MILTTLAAQAYGFCVGKYVFEQRARHDARSGAGHAHFIENATPLYGKPQWRIANETTEGENCAEK